ncbi:MAG TPA: mycothiol synthase [Frankiaceae bacterium]|nr:mycothiol synthase [Frankiaceae bacterium]
MAPSAVAVDVSTSLTGPQVADVRSSLDRTGRADGVVPLSEAARLRLRPDTSDAEHLIASGPDEAGGVGYAQIEPGPAGEADTKVEAELFVDPQWRRRGVGTALGRAVLKAAGERFGQRTAVSMWAHGDLPGSAELAAHLGLVRTRDLWQLRLQLGEPLPEPVVPADLVIRAFRPGADDAAWLHLNATAFASHPEQGSWTAHDLELRLQEPWFDPAGFFLAERNGRLIGFHWTKVHSDEVPPLGEVYVLGVDPAEAGHGLGSLLTTVGLRYLQARGLRTVLLYVEASNPAALTVYERQGFERYAVDVSYRTV